MDEKEKRSDRSTWPVPGGLLIGLGIGFFFVSQNPMALVGGALAGLGSGLIISSLIYIFRN